MTNYTFHRTPLQHQIDAFERFKREPYHALFWEQRARKTWVELNIFRWRYEVQKDIDALIVIAFPNGVHIVWLDELQKDFPPEFLERCAYLGWASGKMATGKRREAALALRDHDGPIVLTMNCEALITPNGWKYLEWLLRKRRVMLVADEASWAANYSARTKKLLTLGRRPNVITRSILDGTPADEGPEDVFYPTQFLKSALLGFTSKLAFRNRYLTYKTDAYGQRVKDYNRNTGSEFDIVTGTQNLDELHAKLMTFGSRVLRKDVSDAPQKTYQMRYFALTPKQRKVYDKARDDYVAELASGQYPLSDVLLRMTRLQMIARNFYPPERQGVACPACGATGEVAGTECERCEGLGYVLAMTKLERIDNRNPALEALIQEAHATRGPMVVWCRFKQDVTDVIDALLCAGRDPLRYDGAIPPAEREANYQKFRAGGGTDIVATIGSGLTRGRDLTRAVCLVYYSNWFSLRFRGQSEDRAEGLDRTFSTDIVDLVAEDTRDVDTITALREKRILAEVIMGDAPSKWI